MEEPSTQLADTRPVLDRPLRVAIPVNVPNRNTITNRDKTIYQTTFSPTAIHQSYYQFYQNNYKDHIFSTQKPSTSTIESSVSMFTPNDADRLINVTEKIQLHKLPIPTDDPNQTLQIISQQMSNKEIPNHSLRYDANLKNQLNDYQVLAVSSKRANKKDVEAMAYASLGVIYDNQEDYITSISYYKQYLSLCEELQDSIGICAAYNCIGLNYMLLVNPLMEKSDLLKNYLITLNDQHSTAVFDGWLLNESNQFSPSKKAKSGTSTIGNEGGNSLERTDPFSSSLREKGGNYDVNKSKYLQMIKYILKAIQAHEKHADACPDLGGKFIANVNLGICYHWMNNLQQSAFHFQDALRISIKMQTLFGQSIAVGNLGLLALHKKDFHTSRTCFDQHLQLIQALMDAEAEIAAWILLSDLCTAQENYADALDNLEEARKIAEKESFLNDLKRIHCLMGIAKGTLQFGQYCSALQYN